jgi:hypothetical protein
MLQPTDDLEKDLAVLARDFVKALEKYWADGGAEWHGRETWTLDPAPFAQLWRDRVLVIFLAMEGGSPVGMILGLRIRPLLTDDRILQVDAVHGDTPGIADGLLRELARAFEYMPETVLILPDGVGDPPLKRTGTRTHGVWKRG